MIDRERKKRSATADVSGAPPKPQEDGPSDAVADACEEECISASRGDGPAIMRFAISENLEMACGVEKMLTSLPIRKPSPHAFVRVHPQHYFDTALLVVKLDGPDELYFVEPAVRPAITTQVNPTRLYLATTREADPFLWPIRLPGSDGRSSGWWDTAHTAANLGRSSWIRLQANMAAGQYDVYRAMGDLPEPEWPDRSFHDLLELATKGRVIDSADHIVLRRLRGEV